MNNRRKLVAAFGAGMLATPLASFAQKQPSRVYQVVVLSVGAGSRVHWHEALKQGLREHGYAEGRNLILERRHAEGKAERLSQLAAELARTRVDIIIAPTDLAIAAAKRATQTIPIVMISSTDPVATGFIASLARPGGNITGLSTMSPELSGKRLELLREVVPGISKVAVLWNPDARGALIDYMETEKAARALHVQLQSVELVRTEDLDQAFSAIGKGGAQALIVPPANPILGSAPYGTSNRDQLLSFALKHRLPAVYGQEEYPDVGGLMSYGPSTTARWKRAATYIDKILKGAKPAELPVEQPTKFELVVNMKTAKALGIKIPPTVMVRADRVIE